MNFITRKRLTKIVKKLAGYCEKHTDCSTCSFCTVDEECIFMQSICPCDWPDEIKLLKGDKN